MNQICRTGERMYLRTQIERYTIELEESLGWIYFKIQTDNGTALRGPKYLKFSLTQGDAALLAEGLREMTSALRKSPDATVTGEKK